MPEDRRRREIGRSDRSCGVCAAVGMTVVESRAVRRWTDLLNPTFDPAVRTYELCAACGAKHHLRDGQRI